MTSSTLTVGLGGRLRTVQLDDVVAGDNDRTTFADPALEELAASIKSIGLVQNPILRPHPQHPDRYQIVAGERRVRALRLNGVREFTAVVRDLDDGAAAEQMLVENVMRVDLNPIEEAKAYRKRLDAGTRVEDLAKQISKTAGHVAARVRLLDLEPDVQHLVATGQLATKSAAYLVDLSPNRQRAAVRAWGDEGLSQAALRALCARLLLEQEQQSMFAEDLVMSTEEYVASARSRAAARPHRRVVELAVVMAGLLEEAGLASEIVAEAREMAAMCVEYKTRRACSVKGTGHTGEGAS